MRTQFLVFLRVFVPSWYLFCSFNHEDAKTQTRLRRRYVKISPFVWKQMIDSDYWKRNSFRKVVFVFFYLLLLAVALQAQSPAHKTMSGESGPETRKRYPAYQAPGLIIRQGETQVILPRQPVYCGATFIFKFNNGDVQVSLAYNSPPEGYKARRSTDGEKTWADARTRITVNAYQFADGELVWFDDMEARPVNQQVRKKTPGVYQIDFFRSKDNGYTETKEIATLYIPDPPGCSAPANCPMYVNDSIVRLRDGSLLACYQLDDNPGERLHTWRSAVMRSTDRGKTWHYLSTVVFDLNLDPETREPAKRSEGFVEPNLLALANGDLLCFMRSGGLGHGRNTPLYMSRSNDDGRPGAMRIQSPIGEFFQILWCCKTASVSSTTDGTEIG